MSGIPGLLGKLGIGGTKAPPTSGHKILLPQRTPTSAIRMTEVSALRARVHTDANAVWTPPQECAISSIRVEPSSKYLEPPLRGDDYDLGNIVITSADGKKTFYTCPTIVLMDEWYRGTVGVDVEANISDAITALTNAFVRNGEKYEDARALADAIQGAAATLIALQGTPKKTKSYRNINPPLLLANGEGIRVIATDAPVWVQLSGMQKKDVPRRSSGTDDEADF